VANAVKRCKRKSAKSKYFSNKTLWQEGRDVHFNLRICVNGRDVHLRANTQIGLKCSVPVRGTSFYNSMYILLI
jgi:hypothetical protein